MNKNNIMKNNVTENFKIAMFGVLYAVMTLILAPGITRQYVNSINTYILIVFFTATLILMFALTIINKGNLKKLLNLYTAEANIILAIYVIDYFIRNFTGNESYMRMLWVSSAFIASFGVYAGLLVSKSKHFTELSNKFWLSFSPTYAFIFIMVFLRKPNTYYELNLKFGEGILSYYDYFIKSFKGDYWMVFNFIGNVVFFVPLIYIVKAFFPKLKTLYSFLICAVIPFLVEGYQYIFKCGSVDIDDIVLNFSGIIIGLIIYEIIAKVNDPVRS